MKRKNILWGFALLVMAMVCCYVFSACGDDNNNDEPKNPLIGAWEIEKTTETIGALEQLLTNLLQENDALVQENIEILKKVETIVATGQFIVQFNEGGEARLYAYNGKGLGAFVVGSWTMTEQALLLGVGTITLPVTNITVDGGTLHGYVGQLPLTFKKIKVNK